MIRRSFLQACAAFIPTGIMASRAKDVDVIVSVDRGDMGLVYDANGSKIEVCIEANLSTGRCVVFELRDGKKFVGCKKLIKHYPSPMRFDSR